MYWAAGAVIPGHLIPDKILILGDSVVIKFARYTTPGFSIFIPNGTSQIQNYNGLGVVFTTYTDDSYLGDSNGDGTFHGRNSGVLGRNSNNGTYMV